MTTDFLDRAFGVVEPVARLDNELNQAFTGCDSVLRIANALNHPETRDDNVLEDCFTQLNMMANRKYSDKTESEQQIQAEKASFDIPETIQEIF